MRMTGEERIDAPRARVWEALNDPEALRQSIPGCHSLDREAEDRLRAVVEVKIGPIGARFNSVVTLSDVQPPNSYVLTAVGQGGTVGSAKSNIRVRLADDPNGTLLSYEVDAQVGGRLAQLGGPLIDATAKQLAGKFFKRFAEVVGEPSQIAAGSSALEPSAVGPGATGRAAGPGAGGLSAAAASASVGLRLASTSAARGSSERFPIAWILALVVAALVGFLVGRGQGTGGSDWMGLAIGLLVVIVAAAGFEFGRRTAAPQFVLDEALLRRLLSGDRQ
jgi:carbon monoxide dehydrogenase subunit G